MLTEKKFIVKLSWLKIFVLTENLLKILTCFRWHVVAIRRFIFRRVARDRPIFLIIIRNIIFCLALWIKREVMTGCDSFRMVSLSTSTLPCSIVGPFPHTCNSSTFDSYFVSTTLVTLQAKKFYILGKFTFHSTKFLDEMFKLFYND